MPPALRAAGYDTRLAYRRARRVVTVLIFFAAVFLAVSWGGNLVQGQASPLTTARNGTQSTAVAIVSGPLPTLMETASMVQAQPTKSDATATAPPTATTTSTATPTASATPRPTATLVATFTPLPSPTVVSRATTPTEFKATVLVAGVNVRQGPGTDFPIVAQLTEAELDFAIVGRNIAGEWWQICCFEDEAAWIAAELVSVSGDASGVPVVDFTLPRLAVTGNRVNVRSGPGLEHAILDTVEAGSQFAITGRSSSGAWWQIRGADGNPGWLSAGAAIIVEGEASAVPIVEPTASESG